MPRLALALTVVCMGGLAAGVSPALGAFPGENGKIVFDSDRQGPDTDIWTMSPNGRNLANLTAGSEAEDGIPNWRADGRKIVFMSDRETPFNPPVPGSDAPDYEIFVMNADGSKLRQVTFNELDDEDPAWSPDGRRLAIRRDLNPVRGETDYDILTMKADGTGERNLTNSPGVQDDHPNWSPDGRKIAFASDRDGDLEIYTMSPNGSNVRQLTFNALAHDEHPNWSPDGRQIAFNRDLDKNGEENFDLFTVPADGGRVRRLTFHPDGDAMPAWSPDGRMITFVSDRDGCCDIFTMRADGGAQVNRTNSEAFDFVPDWQPLVRDDDHHRDDD